MEHALNFSDLISAFKPQAKIYVKPSVHFHEVNVQEFKE